jgi:hypothetical protein
LSIPFHWLARISRKSRRYDPERTGRYSDRKEVALHPARLIPVIGEAA